MPAKGEAAKDIPAGTDTKGRRSFLIVKLWGLFGFFDFLLINANAPLWGGTPMMEAGLQAPLNQRFAKKANKVYRLPSCEG
jgi:hypothetical protein